MDSPRDRRRYSMSPSPRRYRSRSRSRSPPPRREEPNINPGNNLYVTGLSTRVTERELEDHFSREGKVSECRLVVDPRTKDSRGFGFVTMDTLEDANRCIKYLDRSILEGRVISVERAKRKRARTPTPGKYLGVRTAREVAALQEYERSRGRGSYYDDRDRDRDRDHRDSSRRSPRYSPYRDSRERSPNYAPYRDGGGYGSRRSPRYSPYRDSRERSPNYGVYRGGGGYGRW